MKKLTKAGILALAATVGLGVSSVQAGSAKNGYDKQKVVYHVNNIHTATGALRNVKNHLNALGDKNVEIIVVTHSSGAFAMVDGAMGKKKQKRLVRYTTLMTRLPAWQTVVLSSRSVLIPSVVKKSTKTRSTNTLKSFHQALLTLLTCSRKDTCTLNHKPV